jgi:uncharacterized membrane-anchored protein YjiN (DUF445 family)
MTDAIAGRSLPAMRGFATALLGLVALIYIGAKSQEAAHPAWGFLRAFAEAALVGGLADWFAVTALFRRPLGLPIPHTAVIPRSQDRIADALAAFIVDNFLSPDLVAARLRDKDLAAGMAAWLADRDNAARIADAAALTAPGILDALDDMAVANFLRRQAEVLGREARAGPAAGRIVRLLTEQGRHQALIDAALKEAWRWLAENEAGIRARVRDRTAWLWRLMSVDSKAADSLILAIEDTLKEASKDADHPIRARITDGLHDFADRLATSHALQRQVEAVKDEVLSHPATQAYLEGVWGVAKAALRRDADAGPDSAVRQAVSAGLMRLGEGLLTDREAREAINGRVRVFLIDLAGRHGKDVARLVSDTIRSWDAHTLTEKLEINVGRDLQYIRINGTLIGGLVGLLLHTVTYFLLPP